MQIENHKEEVPFAHYEELFKKLDPADATGRLSCVKWDGKEFYVNLLGRDFAISHPDFSIRALDEESSPRCPPRPSCCGTCWSARIRFGAVNGRPSAKCPGVKCTSSPTLAAS